MVQIASSIEQAESAVRELAGVDIHQERNEQFQGSYSSGKMLRNILSLRIVSQS